MTAELSPEWKRPPADWQRGEATGTEFSTGTIGQLRSSFGIRFPLLTNVMQVLPPGTIVAGGVFADLLRGRVPVDIDIFFSDLSLVPEVQNTLRRFEDFDPVTFTPTSSVLRSRSSRITLNLLHSVAFASPSALIDRFDLSPVQVASTPDGRIAYNSVGLEETLAGRMKLHRLQNSLPIRLNKYRFKKFEINDELIEAALLMGAAPYKYQQYRMTREHAQFTPPPVAEGEGQLP